MGDFSGDLHSFQDKPSSSGCGFWRTVCLPWDDCPLSSHGCCFSRPGSMWAFHEEKVSDSYFLLEDAVAAWFNTCAHDFGDEEPFLPDEGGVSLSWTDITRRFLTFPLGPLLVLLTALVHWRSSFLADFRGQFYKSNKYWSGCARSSSVAPRLFAHRRRMVLRMVWSMPSTKNPAEPVFCEQRHTVTLAPITVGKISIVQTSLF